MHARPIILALAVAAAFCRAPSLLAADNGEGVDRYSLGEVVRTVLARHPDLAVSRFDPAITATEAQRIEGTLDPTVNARIGYSDDERPVVSDFQPLATRRAEASGSVEKPLAGGGTLSASADYNRTWQDFAASPFAAQLARINPAYRGSLNLSYRMPLLRGAGRPDYSEGLAAAEADTEAARRQRALIARSLGLQALNAYFLLLNDEIGIRIAEVGVERAQQLLEYQSFREEFGLVEAAETVQAEALLATRRLELQEGRAARAADRVALNRLMLRAADAPLEITEEAPEAVAGSADPGAAFESALDRRPEFDILESQIEAAGARLRVARDTERMGLDLVAEIGTFSLDREAADAAIDVFDTTDRFAGLSLELRETLGDRAAAADLRRAELTRRQLIERRAQTSEQVRDDIADAVTTLQTGSETLRLARARVDAERRKFDVEMERYREGRSDTATVVQFEGELHAAELRAEQQALTVRLAAWQLAWARGTLLDELGIDPQAFLEVAQ